MMNVVAIAFLKRIFDIREGEIRRALLMQINVFLITATLLIVKPTVNGLFLSDMGVEKLPTAFVLVAFFAAIISSLYARYLGRLPLNRIILSTLACSATLFMVFGVVLRLGMFSGWLLYTFYVVVAIFAVLSASQFWILANVVFNAREAKRLFGFVGSGAIAGGIFGGYLTNFLAGIIGSENLLFVGALLLFISLPITSFIWNKYVLGTQSKFQRRKKVPKVDHPLLLIRKSPHLMYLSGIIGVSVIVAKLVDYQFNAIASSLIQDPDELTAFFGLWFSNFNALSLVIQLLITPRLVGNLGIGRSLFFLPASILVGAILIFFFPVLWAAIFIKTSDAGLKQSLNKSAVELLALPIPAEIKNQTKTFIDVVIDSIATGIGGGILIFLVNGLDLSTRFISIMILALIGVWIYFVTKVRVAYLSSFKINVQRETTEDREIDLSNDSVISDLKKVLESGDEGQVLYILKKIKAQPDNRFITSLEALLQHPSPRVQEESIRILYFLRQRNLTNKISPLTKHPVQGVRIAAFNYLIARSKKNIFAIIGKYLTHQDPQVRLTVMISLAEESRDNQVLKNKFKLREYLRTEFDRLPEISDQQILDFSITSLLKVIGLSKIADFFPKIEYYFKNENPEIRKQAILSAGESLHPYFIPVLIEFLADKTDGEIAKTALQSYGQEIIPILATYTKSPSANLEVVRRIPVVLQYFGIQSAVDLLFQLLQNPNGRVRLSALRSLNDLKIQHDHLKFHSKKVGDYVLEEARLYRDTLSIFYAQINSSKHDNDKEKWTAYREERQRLVQLLEEKLDTNLERIIRLLGLKYPPEDVLSVFEGMQSSQSDLRFNALEYLDNLLDPGLKKVLMPLVETALLDSITEEAIRMLNLKVPDEDECFRLLLAGNDPELKNAVQNLVALRISLK